MKKVVTLHHIYGKNRERMAELLKNLVENALRYTPGGGRITLSASADTQVHISVVDTGSGIVPEDLPYVFDRFYRADKARGRNAGKMGLGLSICQSLFNSSHLRFHRQTVLRCTPHFLATTTRGTWSSTSNRSAVALAFGRLGLVE